MAGAKLGDISGMIVLHAGIKRKYLLLGAITELVVRCSGMSHK